MVQTLPRMDMATAMLVALDRETVAITRRGTNPAALPAELGVHPAIEIDVAESDGRCPGVSGGDNEAQFGVVRGPEFRFVWCLCQRRRDERRADNEKEDRDLHRYWSRAAVLVVSGVSRTPRERLCGELYPVDVRQKRSSPPKYQPLSSRSPASSSKR